MSEMCLLGFTGCKENHQETCVPLKSYLPAMTVTYQPNTKILSQLMLFTHKQVKFLLIC